MTTKRILGTCAVTIVAAVSAAGAWFAGAGTALAPEPARLQATLPSATGATAAAVYVTANQPTRVVSYPSTVMSVNAYTPAAGTPCWPGQLPAYQQTSKVIWRSGNYARCQ